MLRQILMILLSFFTFSCGQDEIVVRSSVEDPIGDSCTSNSNNELNCSNGSVIVMPPNTPNYTECVDCKVVLADGEYSVSCPNGLKFKFRSPVSVNGKAGEDGRDGEQGQQGAPGQNGKDGVDGQKGDNGTNGQGCSLGVNALGQTTITCGSQTTVLVASGSVSQPAVWKNGLKGNVYDLPNTTVALPNYALLVATSSVKVADLSLFNGQSSLGYPGIFSTNFSKTTFYGIRYTGEINVPACHWDNCIFRLTSDDGAKFTLGKPGCEVELINNDELHSPRSMVGTSWSPTPGWTPFQLDYFQGPASQIALALEISVDGGNTFRLLDSNEFRFKE